MRDNSLGVRFERKALFMIIGITGGVGSGKSTVLQILEEEYGAALIMADDIARELMKPGQSAYDAVVSFFGKGILSDVRTDYYENVKDFDEKHSPRPIDRSKLAEIVFQNPEALNALNEMTHPLVKEEIMKLIDLYRSIGCPYIVIETAILIQVGYRSLVDELWVVCADYDVRVERLRISRGYTREKTDDIIRSQMPDDEMVAAADFVIDNSGDIDSTRSQIAAHMDLVEAL